MPDITPFQSTVVETPNPAPTNILPPELVEFVGTGKKYASVDDALKSVPHAQKHISTLEQELADAREELGKRKTAEELLADIKAGMQDGSQPTPTNVPTGVTPESIARTVQLVLDQNRAVDAQKSNTDKVITSFVTKFGTAEKAEQFYIALAQENGMTVNDLNKLAATNPTVVLKLAGIDKAIAPPPPKPNSTVNTDGFSQQQSPGELSARVPRGARSKDIVQAWRNAGAKVKQI